MTMIETMLEQIHERLVILTEMLENGKQEFASCKDCAFLEVEEWDMPCKECKHNCKDYFRRKE